MCDVLVTNLWSICALIVTPTCGFIVTYMELYTHETFLKIAPEKLLREILLEVVRDFLKN